jgi:hypothetical protein
MADDVAPIALQAHSKRDGWTVLASVLIIGYFSMSRSFAYFGIPPFKLFIGELSLAALVVFRFRMVIGRWIRTLVAPGALNSIGWAYLLFFAFGLFELGRGLERGFPLLVAIQNFAFHYYPLFLFAGIWLGRRDPLFLRRVLRQLAWFNGVYGTLYVLTLGRVPNVIIPGSGDVPLFGQPGGSAVALLAILAFESDMRKSSVPMLLNGFVMLGVQVRSEWLGFLVAVTLWGVLSGRLNRVVRIGSAIILLLTVGFITDVRLPSPSGRGGAIAVRELVARGIAPLNKDLAAQYSAQSEDADMYAGTFAWRVGWWLAIWDDITAAGPTVKLVGEGYGFPLRDLVNYTGDVVRTPHNIFFFCLGYTGWLGVIIFFGFQATLAVAAWRVFQVTRNPFAIAFWFLSVLAAFFGNFFETPFGAIPFYLVFGAALTDSSFVPRRRVKPGRASAIPRDMALA